MFKLSQLIFQPLSLTQLALQVYHLNQLELQTDRDCMLPTTKNSVWSFWVEDLKRFYKLSWLLIGSKGGATI